MGMTAYHFYAADNEWEWQQQLSWAKYALECEMNRAMCNFWDSNNFVIFLGCLDNK
jgi:hypothetical protein